MEGCHCYARFITTSIAVSVAFLMFGSQVDASATLKLLMVSFDNPTSKDAGGGYCDHGPFHLNECDHIFRFVLDRGNSNNDPEGSPSKFWTHTTGHFQNRNHIVFGHDMAGVANPIVTALNTWPSIGVKFKVLVTENDHPGGDDTVDGFIQLLRLTPAANPSAANWTTVNMLGTRRRDRTRMTMKYKLYCDANYYTSACSVYCVATDTDAGGHYTCDPSTGNKICRPGWEDVSRRCRTRSNDCINNACENGATCVDGARTYTCLCPPGYTGPVCETDINECASTPCQQGGTCVDQVNGFICQCPHGFTGKLCSNVYQSTNVLQSTNSIINSTVTPRRSGVLISQATSVQPWLYVMICAICIVLLGILVLIAFLWTRRRKRTNGSDIQPPASPPGSPACSSPSPPSYTAATEESADAAGFCVVTGTVDVQSYGRRMSREKLVALNDMQDDSGRKFHVYDQIAAQSQ